MRVEEALYSELINTAGVFQHVHLRIYPVVAPDQAQTPFIVYQVMSETGIHAMNDDPTTTFSDLQLSIWGRSYTISKTVSDAVKAALRDFEGLLGGLGGLAVQKITYEGEHDIFDTETGRYHIPLEFTICH